MAVIENWQFSGNNKKKQYSYITQFRFDDEKNFHKSTIPKSYQYKDGKWIFLGEYKN